MRTQIEKLEDNMVEVDEVQLLDDEAFKESLIGVSSDMRAVYDYEKMAEEYARFNGCDIMEAREHIDYNIIRSLPCFGDKAPIIIDILE